MPNHCRFIAEFSVESSSHTLDWRLMSQFHWDSLFPCYIYHFWILGLSTRPDKTQMIMVYLFNYMKPKLKLMSCK